MVSSEFLIGLVIGVVVGPLLAVLAIYLCARKYAAGMTQGGLSPPELPNETEVALDWNVQTLDGTEVNLADLFAGQPVLLNFWATWCGPCVAELPAIERLYHRFKDQVGFACISEEQPGVISRFLEDQSYTVPLYVVAKRPPDDFKTDGIPATFLLSGDRRVVLKHVGAADWAHESVIRFVENFLGQA